MVSLAAKDMTPVASTEDVERKVGKAKALLILDHPFFGVGVSRRPIIYTDSVPTAAMAATGQMYINPAFVADGTPENGPLTVRNLMFLLAHEALHYMLCHGLRRKHRDPRAWNIAADKVINDTLIDAKVGDFIAGGVTMRDARNYAAEELYDENDNENDNENGGGGIGDDIGDPTDADGNQLDDSQIRQIEAQVKIEVVQAAKAAKSVGKLPSSIERIVDQIVNVTTPWHDVLERFMVSKIKDGYSWSRPNRRFIAKNIYIPGTDYKPKMGTLVIGVDTSGSIDQEVLNYFGGHINRILSTCNPESVIVVYCDAKVQAVDEYAPDDYPVQLVAHGGGGTSFKPVFDYIDDNNIEPECVVYLTDGYGDQAHFTSAHETVWLTTHSVDFTWGTVIKAEV
jgi:predicted metal-dependent peptidase